MEKSLNKVELKGNVGHDTRVTITENGGKVIRFSLATTEIVKYRNGELKEETSLHNVSAWSIKGMPDLDKIKKGMFVEIIGKIRYSKYKGVDNVERNIVEIVAQKIIIPLSETISKQ